MQVYQRLERAKALGQGVYVMRAGQMKVLRIRNASDVGIEGVRVEVTLNDGAIAARLTWSLNDSEIADLRAAGSSARRGRYERKGRLYSARRPEREYDRGLWYHNLPPGMIFLGVHAFSRVKVIHQDRPVIASSPTLCQLA
jgi:hypothetical protein